MHYGEKTGKVKKTIKSTTILNRINIEANLPSSRPKLFRKPRHIMRVLPIHTESYFVDQSTVQEDMKGWMTRLRSSRSVQAVQKNEEGIVQLTDRNKERILDFYCDIRRHEAFAHSLPMTDRKEPTIKREPLKMNLKEIEKIRSKTQTKKIAIVLSEFKNTLKAPSGHTIGFRHPPDRHHSKAQKRDSAISVVSLPNNYSSRFCEEKREQRSLTKKKMVNNSQFDRLFNKSSRNLLFSEFGAGKYKSKSKLRTPWETVGTNLWKNKSPHH